MINVMQKVFIFLGTVLNCQVHKYFSTDHYSRIESSRRRAISCFIVKCVYVLRVLAIIEIPFIMSSSLVKEGENEDIDSRKKWYKPGGHGDHFPFA